MGNRSFLSLPRFNLARWFTFFGWIGLCLLLSLMIASQFWVGVLFILGALSLVALVLVDLRIAAVLWLIGIPSVFVFPNNLMKNLPFITVDRVLFMTLLGMLFVRAAFDKTRRQRLSRTEIFILVFLGIVLVSFLSTVPEKSLHLIRIDVGVFAQGYVMPLLAFFIARRVEWQERDISLIVCFFVIIGVYLTFVGVLQYFFGVTIFNIEYWKRIHEERVTGTFANASEYGAVMVAFLLLTLMLFVQQRSSAMRWLLAIASMVIFAGVLLSKTRAPSVGLLCALTFLYVADRRTRGPIVLVTALGTVALLVAAPFLGEEWRILQERITETAPIYNRIALYATGLNIFIHNLLTGIGFGYYAFAEAKWDYLTSFGSVPAEFALSARPPHNEFLHVAVLTGLPGIVFFLLIFYSAYRRLQVARSDPTASPVCRDMALYATAILLTYLVNGLFVDLVYFGYFGILLFFLIGAVASLYSGPLKSPQTEPQRSQRSPVGRS